MSVEGWWLDARCAGLPQDVFFSEDEEDQEAAIIICQRCPVMAECLAYSFETDETMREGVFGGTTPQERTDYARARGIQPRRIVDGIRSAYTRGKG